MDLLCIDIGTYSVKFFEGKVERKKFSLFSFSEIQLPDEVESEVKEEDQSESSEQEGKAPSKENKQFQRSLEAYKIVVQYLEKTKFVGKIVYQAPNYSVTSRILELPIQNRKKAEMMIPFQLDENLPYAISEAHFVSRLTKKGKINTAHVTISEKSEFGEIFNSLQEMEVLPSVLTSEVSILDSFVRWHGETKTGQKPPLKNDYAIIDIGHSTTKAYFVRNGELVANHIGHIGGKDIDETLATCYDISTKEASQYKHQNAFFLTEDQYSKVDKDQAEFAAIMKESFWPLVLDLKRWDLGHRVRFGMPVEAIYITGGTSNVKNINNFLTQAVGIPVHRLEVDNVLAQKKIKLSDESKLIFGLSQLMALSQMSKSSTPNLLVGEFSNNFQEGISLHSTFFLAARTSLVAFVLLFFLLIEKAILQRDLKILRSQITSMVKNPKLEFTDKEKRTYRRYPERSVNKLKKKRKQVVQQVKSLMSAKEINAVSPLVKLSQLVRSNEVVHLISFNSSDKIATALFESDDKDELKKLKDHLSLSGLPNADMKFKNKFAQLEVSFELE